MLGGSQSFYQGGNAAGSKVNMPVKLITGRTTLNATWKLPSNARECEVKLTGGKEVRIEKTSNDAIDFFDLHPGTEYVVVVTPMLSNGKGAPVVRRAVTEREARLPCIQIPGGELPEDSDYFYDMDVENDTYGNILGEECVVDKEGYKFVSFECGIIYRKRNFRIKLHGMEGPWKEHCGTLCCTLLHVKVYGEGVSTGWMDANNHVIPFSDTMYNDGYRCLKGIGSKLNIRNISFGGNIFSGRVVCRLGLPRDGKKISGISILE